MAATRKKKRSGGIFVTATDTGVGKTVVAAGLAASLHRLGADVGVMKPIATGAAHDPAGLYSADARFLARAVGLEREGPDNNPICLEPPLAPLAAAESEKVSLDLSRVWASFQRLKKQHDFLIVEGIGGLRVPLTEDFDVRDLLQRMGLPVLVVGRAGLGTINHTLLTLDALRARKIHVLGVVLNAGRHPMDLSAASNAAMIQRCSGIPVLAEIPRLPEVDVESGQMEGLLRFAGFRSLAMAVSKPSQRDRSPRDERRASFDS